MLRGSRILNETLGGEGAIERWMRRLCWWPHKTKTPAGAGVFADVVWEISSGMLQRFVTYNKRPTLFAGGLACRVRVALLATETVCDLPASADTFAGDRCFRAVTLYQAMVAAPGTASTPEVAARGEPELDRRSAPFTYQHHDTES
jgi:hypothetical protein